MRLSAWLFGAALLAGASYVVPVAGEWRGDAVIAWKGAGVGLLSAWALACARYLDGRVIATVLALGALGDVMLDAIGLMAGGLSFLAGHLVAIGLYRRHAAHGWAIIAGAAVGVGGAAMWLTRDPLVTLYGCGLGAMAGAASASAFPRAVALGAWLFVTSDLLIFARSAHAIEGAAVGVAIWILYFAGQALIAHGVVTSLAGDDHLHHRL